MHGSTRKRIGEAKKKGASARHNSLCSACNATAADVVVVVDVGTRFLARKRRKRAFEKQKPKKWRKNAAADYTHTRAGWPDEFIAKIAQNVAQNI
jgi:hypothetical protein